METYCPSPGEPPANPYPLESPPLSSSLPSPSAEETLLYVSKNVNNVVRGPNSHGMARGRTLAGRSVAGNIVRADELTKIHHYLLNIYPYVDLLTIFSKNILGFLFGRRVNPSGPLLPTNDDNHGSQRFENSYTSEVGHFHASRRSGESYQPSPSSLTLLLAASHDQPSIVPNLTGQVTRGADLVFAGNYSTVVMGDWNGTKVAIKDIRGQGTLVATKRRLKREREVWGCLKHENILPLYGYVDDFGLHGALISPWYKHGQSGEHIRKNELRASQRFELWCDVIKGMVYLHSPNPVLIHGDLKPINVLVDDDGRARIWILDWCGFFLTRRWD
ncbi:kinase-like protein [Serendipita vermifera]|nr:kinase-like protein [Serendipita vermifera]